MVEAILLGVAQDGGRPQAGCQENCCTSLGPGEEYFPVSLGLLDDSMLHLIDVSRSLAQQLRMIEYTSIGHGFLTHAHFGHVDGLGLFGKETMNARAIPLHLSASMLELMRQTPQWNVLIEDGVVVPHVFADGHIIRLSSFCSITPLRVPHRAEFTDMHAFVIEGNGQRLLYLPDHDTWDETLNGQNLREWFGGLNIDIALIDGTFWSLDELRHRKQTEVPHPPVSETIARLGQKRENDPEVVFIHLNHTNPLYQSNSKQARQVRDLGWNVGHQGQRFSLS